MKKLFFLTFTILLISACNPSGNKAIIPLEEEHSSNHETHQTESHNKEQHTTEAIDSTAKK